jgi:hypothetical protein
MAMGAISRTNAQVYTGTKIGKNGSLDDYYLSIENYFHIAEKEILDFAGKKIPDEDLPVVFFMAQKAGTAPQAIADLRSGGMGWMKIARHFNFTPRIFYVPVLERTVKAPYKRIYELYRGDKAHLKLSDADIVNLVNLKLMSNHYGRDPQEIIQMRNKGETFPDIDDTLRQEKDDMAWDPGNPPLEARDSKGLPDPRKNGQNSLNPAEKGPNP